MKSNQISSPVPNGLIAKIECMYVDVTEKASWNFRCLFTIQQTIFSLPSKMCNHPTACQTKELVEAPHQSYPVIDIFNSLQLNVFCASRKFALAADHILRLDNPCLSFALVRTRINSIKFVACGISSQNLIRRSSLKTCSAATTTGPVSAWRRHSLSVLYHNNHRYPEESQACPTCLKHPFQRSTSVGSCFLALFSTSLFLTKLFCSGFKAQIRLPL